MIASVVVPTQNRQQLLTETLSSVLSQDVAREKYEVIVVDDGSVAPVIAPDGVTVIRHSEARGPNAARNSGARAATSDLIVYIDDDIEAPPDWLSSIIDGVHRHPDAQCFTGKVLLRLEGGGLPFCDEFSLSAQGESQLDFGPIDAVAPWTCSANMAIRRSAFELVGRFDEDHPIYHEENEWSNRLKQRGLDVVYLSDAMLWHRRTRDDLRIMRRLRRSFRRGYAEAFTRALADAPYTWVDLLRSTRGVPWCLKHSLRHRCTFGVCTLANEFGKWWWLVSRLRATEAAG